MRRSAQWGQQGRGRGSGGRNQGPRGNVNIRPFVDDMQPSPLAGGGPLVSDHLQLHDLDLELALLKRKRELIEQQQTMLMSDQFGSSSQYRFDQPRDNFGQQYGTARKYDAYSERGSDRYERQPAKRAAHGISVWEGAPPPAKRAPGPAPPSRPPRPKAPSQSRPPSLMTAPAPRPNQKFQPRDRPAFKSGRVSKPRPQAAPNKLDGHPVAERKKLVASAIPQTKVKDREEMVFDSKSSTCTRLLGRLELALGTLLREMRSEHGAEEAHAATFAETRLQRQLKQAIRDRIRNVMDGKVVGTCSDVIDLYRARYPKAGDRTLLNKVANHDKHQKNIAIQLIEADNPEHYFKTNFNKLLSHSLNKMFQKLSQAYAQERGEKMASDIYGELITEVGKELAEAKNAANKEKDQAINENKTKADESTAVGETATEGQEKPAENGQESKTEAENIAEVTGAEENIAEVTGAEENATEEAAPENTEKTENSDQVAQADAAPTEMATETVETATETVQKAEENEGDTNADIDLSGLPEPDFHIDTEVYQGDRIKSRFFTRLVESLLRRQLPVVLPRCKRAIMNLLRLDPEFVETKDFLVSHTKEKQAVVAQKEKSKVEKPPMNTPDGKPLYVKIVGRPILPRKKSMKTFIDQFNPIITKKQRNVHNILFVGFDNVDNYNEILSKNGTMFGNIKLDIKVSEWTKKKPNNNSEPTEDNAENSAATEQNAEDTSVVDTTLGLDESLDDQITDLLTTIRDDEERKNDGEEEGNQLEEEQEQNEVENTEEAAPEDNVPEDVTENIPETIEENVLEEEGNHNGGVEEKIEESQEENQAVEAAKTVPQAKSTPTRASSRVTATPRTVATRRASKLAQNN